MRQSLFGFIALTLALGLFAVMDVLISNDLNYEKPDKSRAYLNFIRIDPATRSLIPKIAVSLSRRLRRICQKHPISLPR